MNNTDLISVIIPTYNRAHLIKRSVDSVLNQTYKNLELIIVDDGSTDNTKEIIDSINDNRIVYVKQENQGASAARNTGIDLAKGRYISFQDSDDVWLLDKLEVQIQRLKENNADVVFGKKFVFGNLRRRIEPKQPKEGFLKKSDLPLTLGTATLFGKREIFLENKFDTTIRCLVDFELALRINKKYSVYCIDRPLINNYIQQDSISIHPELSLTYLEKIFKENKNFINEYSFNSLEGLSLLFINKAFNLKDKKRKNDVVKFAFSINKSNKVKITYLFYKFRIYKIRELMVKSISIPTKNIIKLFRKVI